MLHKTGMVRAILGSSTLPKSAHIIMGYSGLFITKILAAMVENSKYNVYIGSSSFVHNTLATNISGNLTYFDNPLVNRDPDAWFLHCTTGILWV